MKKRTSLLLPIFLFLPILSSCTPLCTALTSSQNTSPPSLGEARTIIVRDPCPVQKLTVIGAIEPVYILPMTDPLSARIDTGAETSSLHAGNIKPFERDGEKWVAFDVLNEKTGKQERFEKKIIRKTSIKRILDDEDRIVILMKVKFGRETLDAAFTLADRTKFTYPVLIGRNILLGRAIVDVAEENTLN